MNTATLDLPPIVDPGEPARAPEVASEVVDRAQIVNGTPLVKYSLTEAGLATLKADLSGKTYDLTTTKGNDAARGDRLRCVTLRTSLEKRRKEFKAPALAYGKLIDTEAARITAEIEALESPIDAQIKADEQRRAAIKAEQERIEREAAEAHAARMATIAGYVEHCRAPDMTAARIGKGIDILTTTDVADADNARAVQLADAKCRALDAMWTLHAQATAREAEAARQESIRAENAREAARIAEEAAAIRREAAALEAARAAEVVRENQRKAAEEAARAESERLQASASAFSAAMSAAISRVGIDAMNDALPDQGDRKEQFSADELDRMTVLLDGLQPAAQVTERQGARLVLKAEPVMADATDCATPATTSPRVGAMGEGQAADAASAVDTDPIRPDDPDAEPPMTVEQMGAEKPEQMDDAALMPALTGTDSSEASPELRLGAIGVRLGFAVTEAFLTSLGYPRAGTDKRAVLYRESDWPGIKAALVKHIQGLP